MLIHQALLPSCWLNGEIAVRAFNGLPMNLLSVSSHSSHAGESHKVFRVPIVHALQAKVLVILGLGSRVPEKVLLKRLLVIVATNTELTLVPQGRIPLQQS